MPVNIINSYAHDTGPFYYGSSMSIFREVEIEKIILWEETLIPPGSTCLHNFYNSEHEVWVMEDNMFGEIEMDASCFCYKKLDSRCGQRRFVLDSQIDRPLFVQDKDIPKPCEWNKFTKWIIKKNKEQIEQTFSGRFEEY